MSSGLALPCLAYAVLVHIHSHNLSLHCSADSLSPLVGQSISEKEDGIRSTPYSSKRDRKRRPQPHINITLSPQQQSLLFFLLSRTTIHSDRAQLHSKPTANNFLSNNHIQNIPRAIAQIVKTFSNLLNSYVPHHTPYRDNPQYTTNLLPTSNHSTLSIHSWPSTATIERKLAVH
ncbi:hypothetical protein BU24DRAFT_283587 [Aaosphaeria arxii CBS 175.79]|uniref:Uncharacterized protein n=1 Tax=Aaosphaeria arxii CBS 175.79 TaxID=1450172 RepID=A0A6A5XFE6_9PLEO|nr:uncharacterized protein BU24DRAFT_283587 [Aaosphaeria arxii CBS 175.79]KAF2011551.1 hypothetical protein BU24DRAFT_283587 [Aaosphaeria arxii CBS 175.79]